MKITLPTKTRIQSLLFCPLRFSRKQAKDWAKQHGFRTTSLDTEGNYTRLRQDDPEMFQPGTFRTIELRPGVKAVIGRPWIKFTGNPHPSPDNDARELFKTIHVDWRLHKRKHAIYASLAKAKGLDRWSSTAASRKFKPLVIAAAKVYRREHKIKLKMSRVFPPTTIERTTRLLMREYGEYWRKGQLDQYIPRKGWKRRQEK